MAAAGFAAIPAPQVLQAGKYQISRKRIAVMFAAFGAGTLVQVFNQGLISVGHTELSSKFTCRVFLLHSRFRPFRQVSFLSAACLFLRRGLQ